MKPQQRNNEWNRPLHSEIREAIDTLGSNGFEEVREALHTGFESFEAQMKRRMKTRCVDHRAAYKTLARAGEEKVRFHLAVVDMEGLKPPRRRQRTPIDRSRLVRKQRSRRKDNTAVAAA